MQKLSWKQMHLNRLESFYGRFMEEFEGFSDDRMIYRNTYQMIQAAVESLPEEPHCFVKVAMNKQIAADEGMMDRIILRFHFNEK